MRPWNTGPLHTAVILGAAALFVNSAFGAPITGLVNIDGSTGILTDTGTTIEFNPNSFGVAGGNTGSFAGLAGTTGTIMNLNVATEPVGSIFPPIPGYIVFSGNPPAVPNPNIRLDLNLILPGDFPSTACNPAGTPAPGQVCTPPPGFGGAPGPNAIDLTNAVTGINPDGSLIIGSTATLKIAGIAVNTATMETSSWGGILTAQFRDRPYQTLLTDILNGVPVSTSWSAQITATSAIPEPATYILLGCGLIGISALRRVRRT